MVNIKNDWDNILKDEFNKDYYKNLRKSLKNEYENYIIYPDVNDIFNAFKFTSYKDLKVVIIGQDPYINPDQAHGLSFSVKKSVKIPPSLKNIYRELEDDIGFIPPNHGNLTEWTRQGVLLLNSTLTVRAGLSNSHKKIGWSTFTDNIIKIINNKDCPVVFLLWGNNAIKKAELLNNPKHLILTAKHPSPLAGGAFFGCKHFSKTNVFLSENKVLPIDWSIKN